MSRSATPSQDMFLALCDDDKCPWKHRGVTGPVTNRRGQEHADESGHTVTIYFEHRWTLEPGK